MNTILLIAILLLSSSFADLKGQISKKSTSSLEKLIIEHLDKYNTPGLAIGIIKDNDVLYSRGFGFRDIENHLPVTTETQFGIASLTKSFTSFSAAILVDKGLMDWEKPLVEFVSDFKMKDPYVTANINMRDLLCHRTGLAGNDAMYYFFPNSREEIYKRLK